MGLVTEDNTNILHIYGQPRWHDEAEIDGTREALTALRGAIDEALRDGKGECLSFVNDGEGFRVVVRLQLPADMEPMRVPYTHPDARDQRL